MSFDMMHMPGPCVVCGDTNYTLSCGGPTICPKCDCGNFDAATVMKQAKVIAELREQLRCLAQEAKPCGVAALDQAWDEINALGGSKMYASGYDLGICDTVERALEIIEALGGMDPKQRPASSVPSAHRGGE